MSLQKCGVHIRSLIQQNQQNQVHITANKG